MFSLSQAGPPKPSNRAGGHAHRDRQSLCAASRGAAVGGRARAPAPLLQVPYCHHQRSAEAPQKRALRYKILTSRSMLLTFLRFLDDCVYLCLVAFLIFVLSEKMLLASSAATSSTSEISVKYRRPIRTLEFSFHRLSTYRFLRIGF